MKPSFLLATSLAATLLAALMLAVALWPALAQQDLNNAMIQNQNPVNIPSPVAPLAPSLPPTGPLLSAPPVPSGPILNSTRVPLPPQSLEIGSGGLSTTVRAHKPRHPHGPSKGRVAQVRHQSSSDSSYAKDTEPRTPAKTTLEEENRRMEKITNICKGC